jgi:hypothetical protein
VKEIRLVGPGQFRQLLVAQPDIRFAVTTNGHDGSSDGWGASPEWEMSALGARSGAAPRGPALNPPTILTHACAQYSLRRRRQSIRNGCEFIAARYERKAGAAQRLDENAA